MTYKIAKADSIEPIRELAIEFMATLGEDIDPDHYMSQWQRFFETGIGVVYYLNHGGKVVGGIGALEAPDLLSGKSTLVELFWYVTPEHRRGGVALYNAMERYAQDNSNVKRFAMIHMERSMPEKLKEFYIKKGFRLLETHWIKEV